MKAIGVKKSSKAGGLGKRLVQPIPLDNCGRPIFPIVLGGLTVHSLGEVSNHGDFTYLCLILAMSNFYFYFFKVIFFIN